VVKGLLLFHYVKIDVSREAEMAEGLIHHRCCCPVANILRQESLIAKAITTGAIFIASSLSLQHDHSLPVIDTSPNQLYVPTVPDPQHRQRWELQRSKDRIPAIASARWPDPMITSV
jgi:hypothetical protein